METTGATRPLHLCEVCEEPATDVIEGFALCNIHVVAAWNWIENKLPEWSVYTAIDVGVWSMRDRYRQLLK